jgi:glycolate oxidase iron-sulfur subunit
MSISERYEDIAHCNRCGFCQTACPVFRSTGVESGVARGRLALLRALIEERLEWTSELEAPLYTCLLCGACTSNCFPAIPTSELVIAARSEYLERVGRSPVHRLLFDQLLPYPRRLHLAARAAAFGKNSGAARLARALGLLRVFGRSFSEAERIVERLPAHPFRDRFKPGTVAGRGERLRTAYFVGCGIDVVDHSAGEATFALLRRISRSVTVLENNCCGLPAWSYGDLPAARRLAGRNLQMLRDVPADVIVSDCSSCTGFLKKYARLFPEGHLLGSAASEVASRCRDLSEIVAADRPSSSPDLRGRRLTFHDPCHASRGQGIVNEPRALLRRIPGVDFVELPEADWCCGGAGSYALSHYGLSMQVLDRKIENLRKSGADMLLTTCPACILQLSHGVRRHGLDAKVEVRHLSEVI